jgi:hypothetical protein
VAAQFKKDQVEKLLGNVLLFRNLIDLDKLILLGPGQDKKRLDRVFRLLGEHLKSTNPESLPV